MNMATTGNEDVTEKDWMFDYLLSLLRSPQWDISIMGFIDENCAVFDTDDENKLSYTSLHRQFKDLVETLCSSSLADVGIGIEDFVDALEASKLRHDISKSVYEQLIAVDDFVTFKKLMVKRNFELELEAVQALQEQQLTSRDDKVDCSIAPMRDGEDLKGDGDRGSDPGEEFLLPRGSPQHTVESEGTSALEKQLERAMEANLRELELMHKREEVEQAELEQAIAMSLALESNRSDPEPSGDREMADRKGIYDDYSYAGSVDGEATNNPTYAEEKLSSSVSRKGDKEWKSLPPLSSTRHAGGGGRFRPAIDTSGENFRDPGVESTSRKRSTRAASEKAQALLGERKCAQEVLKGQISEEEAAQRERHLKEMRNRIVSAKRAEREEQALKAKVTPIHVQPNDAPERSSESATKRGEEDVPSVANSEEEFADEQRRAMRMALARRMKRELVETERDRLTKVREDQFADLNDKLCSVEKLRVENAAKEAEIAQVLLHQQQQRARNMALSAATAQRNDEDEFTFGERG